MVSEIDIEINFSKTDNDPCRYRNVKNSKYIKKIEENTKTCEPKKKRKTVYQNPFTKF